MRPFKIACALALAVPCAAATQTPVPTPVASPAAPLAPPPPPQAVPRPVESIPGMSRLTPAEVAYVHPLYRALETPPKVVERSVPADLEQRVPIFLAVHVPETGRVSEVVPVEPPLKGLATPVGIVTQKWRFTPARKGGQPVATWVTYRMELNVELEKAAFSAFALEPVDRETPLAPLVKEPKGDDWMARYSKEIVPKDPGAVSIEDVDVLPAPEKTSWSFDAARARSRVTALLEISAAGAVARILPTGDSEPLLVAWLRQTTPKWKITPATAGGTHVSAWMTLDLTMDYTISSAKKKAERVLKKNLRASPAT
jgi:hypothetical protein